MDEVDPTVRMKRMWDAEKGEFVFVDVNTLEGDDDRVAEVSEEESASSGQDG